MLHHHRRRITIKLRRMNLRADTKQQFYFLSPLSTTLTNNLEATKGTTIDQRKEESRGPSAQKKKSPFSNIFSNKREREKNVV